MTALDQTPDVTLIVNGHREGRLAHHTLRALDRSVSFARGAGLRVEVLAVLDNADDATREIFAEAAGPEGYLARGGPARIVEVSVADLGEARNLGVAEAAAPVVGVLDADNLPSENWLLEAHRTLVAHGGRCVVHPEHLVIFEGRSVLWPQWSTADSRFRRENFFDQNYWDAFCLASREVFLEHPYAPTGRGSGFGPEDWHWNAEVVHAGVPHLVAPGTALFYRAKTTGSLMAAHRAGGSLIHQTALLTDPAVARGVVAEAGQAQRPSAPRRTKLLKRILRQRRKKTTEPAPPAPLGRAALLRARLDPGFVACDHYRYLYDVPDWSDAEVRDHYRSHGRDEGRRRWLAADELAALAPKRFRADHYRVLNGAAMHLDKAAARLHYLSTGRREGLRARLSPAELDALALLDLDDYRAAHADLTGLKDVELVQHFLEHGIPERRRPFLTPGERALHMPVEVSDALAAEWREMHRFEPWVPVPSETTLERYRLVGPPYDGSLTLGSTLWWQLVAALGEHRPDFVFLAPWLRLGGADLLLARYARTVAELRPDARVVVITTHDHSTHEELLDDSVTLVDLPQMEGYAQLSVGERARLVATVLTQYRPAVAHVFNSPEGFDALEQFPRAMSAHTRLFLSTFVIDYGPDGEIHNHLVRRPTDYLDAVSKVVVDSEAFIDELHELYRMDRSKFSALRQPVDLPQPRAWTAREQGAPLQVLWAARFDRQKRLDVLADVADAAAKAGLDVDWHVYGAPVVTTAAEVEGSIARLESRGATFHEAYSSLDDLPLDDYDLFLMTSEKEGVPNTLLEMMARRLPVMAPLVGGIPEVLDETVGWPVVGFDDAEAYVAALEQVASARDEAERRADAALTRLHEEFSWEAFRRRVSGLDGYLP